MQGIKLNSEQLEQVKIAANLFFTPERIALMIDLPFEDIDTFKKLCLNQEFGGEIFRAYQSGKIEQEMVLRKSILQSAKNGSPPAQSLAEKLLLGLNLNER